MPIDKVIVVEDDLIIRRSLEAQLRQRRCDVMAVSTLAAAKEALAKDTFDLVFLDVRLPDGEGTDWLKELQQRPQRPHEEKRGNGHFGLMGSTGADLPAEKAQDQAILVGGPH